ncbi:MAG: hypothetical protein H6684_16600 [Deltaproteobacteria bacterium]|nr:hypothetical protein [Deltaproteobacteria bacterium]MCB9490354.1 hypothetical protein [Deltaproteobacteria bacterium]
MKVVFRVEAGDALGWGRLSRTAALAWELRAAQAQVTVALTGGGGAMLDNFGIAHETLAAPSGKKHQDQLVSLCSGADLLVVDAPIPSLELARVFALIDPTPVLYVTDDPHGYLSVSAVLNPNADAPSRMVDAPRNVRLMLGPRFAPIRPDVASARPEEPTPWDQFRVAVCFPPPDEANLTGRVLAALNHVAGNFHVDVIASEDMTHFDAVREQVESMNVPTNLVVDPENIGEVFVEASLGVCPGGMTALEYACLGVAGAYLTDTTHADEGAAALALTGLGHRIGLSETVSDDGLIAQMHLLIDKRRLREAYAQTARAQVDAKGARRVLEKLIKDGLISLALPEERPGR